jgi:hypothetical protein
VERRVIQVTDGQPATGRSLPRKPALKLRDDPRGHLVLLLSDTRSNRAALRQLRESVRPILPLETRELLAALGRGMDAGGSGIVIM